MTTRSLRRRPGPIPGVNGFEFQGRLGRGKFTWQDRVHRRVSYLRTAYHFGKKNQYMGFYIQKLTICLNNV